MPVEFILFAATLLALAVFHRYAFWVALAGAIAITANAWLGDGFESGGGWAGLLGHAQHEWVILANLFALLVGFTLLAEHFEQSEVTQLLPNVLPDDARGPFVLLCVVFVLSGFLDNIAAAMIGGTMAAVLFDRRVHVGYLAAIVAAANGGGAGSVVGDTTTIMLWLAGAHPLQVLEAYVGGAVALLVFGTVASLQQHRKQPIRKDSPPGVRVDWARLCIVGIVLAGAIGANVAFTLHAPEVLDAFPVMGAVVLAALAMLSVWRAASWHLVPRAAEGAVFLLALVWCASLMPVNTLPDASALSTFALGVVSAVFDNIPLTALAIEQGGYDWGLLAFAVGFGGSMIWFGSSAGVAMSNIYPEVRSVVAWIHGGWHVALGYVLGYLAMLVLFGWQPEVLGL